MLAGNSRGAPEVENHHFATMTVKIGSGMNCQQILEQGRKLMLNKRFA